MCVSRAVQRGNVYTGLTDTPGSPDGQGRRTGGGRMIGAGSRHQGVR